MQQVVINQYEQIIILLLKIEGDVQQLKGQK